MQSGAKLWWLPGVLIGLVGLFILLAGFATGGPDIVGGMVFGGVALAAEAVILWRRVPKDTEPGEGKGER